MKTFIKKRLLTAFITTMTSTSFVGLFVTLLPNIADWPIKFLIILGIAFILFVTISLILIFVKKRTIGSFNNVKISAMYGDVLKIKKKKKGSIPVVVIPVNSAFDYIVEEKLNQRAPIVSKKTIHGQWIIKLTQGKEELIEQLGKEINHSIQEMSPKIVETLKEKRGNQTNYELGSHIFIERDDCGYLLFALSEFDENNHVKEKMKSVYCELIKKLMDATDGCQGRDAYIPIMGTGLSLFGISHKDAFEEIKAAALNKKMSLKSNINIVVFYGDIKKASIYD